MIEKTLQANIKKELQKLGCLVYKVEARGQAGFPDLLVVLDGVSSYLEVKTKTGRLSRLQEHCIKQMREHGARVFVVRTPAEALAAVTGESKQ